MATGQGIGSARGADDHGQRRSVPRPCRHPSSRRCGAECGGCQHYPGPDFHVFPWPGHGGRGGSDGVRAVLCGCYLWDDAVEGGAQGRHGGAFFLLAKE